MISTLFAISIYISSSGPITSELHKLLLDRNFFKLSYYLQNNTENNNQYEHALAKAYIFYLERNHEESINILLSCDDKCLSNLHKDLHQLHNSLIKLNYYDQQDYEKYLDLYSDKDSENMDNFYIEFRRRLSEGKSYIETIYDSSIINFVNKNSKIVISVDIDGFKRDLIFDTGSDYTILWNEYDAFKTNNGNDNCEIDFQNNYFKTAKKLSINNIKQYNINIRMMNCNNVRSNFGIAHGVIGFPEILRVGGFNIQIEKNKPSSILLYRPENFYDKKSNIFIFNFKPIIETYIGNNIYSCLIDTGAPFSSFSRNIYEDNKKSLSLGNLGKKRTVNYLGKSEILERRELKRLPLTIGDQSFEIRNALISTDKKSANDWCTLGMDAVIDAGGVTLDFVNRIARFGPPDNLPSASDAGEAPQP